METRVTEALRQAFIPEFLNRIDEVVIFNNLSREEIKDIVDIQLRRLTKILSERKIGRQVTERAKDLLAEKGYDPVYGARPLKRTIQKLIQDPLAMRILQGKFKEGDRVQVDDNGNELVFTSAGPLNQQEEALAGRFCIEPSLTRRKNASPQST